MVHEIKIEKEQQEGINKWTNEEIKKQIKERINGRKEWEKTRGERWVDNHMTTHKNLSYSIMQSFVENKINLV